MEVPALRDVERWKDKIEVRLDNRQVFFLFFGSAMVACMLFVLGVIVGKRLESRGRAEAPSIDDPLAVLDRFGPPQPGAATAGQAALTFPKNLIGGGPAATGGRSHGSPSSREERPAGLREGRSAPAARSVLAAVAPAAAVPRMVVAVREPADVAPRATRAGTAAPALAPSDVGLPSGTDPGLAAAASPSSAPTPRLAAAPASRAVRPTGAGPTATSPDKARGHFLLQLSSFQDRAEADAFARRFPGKNAYVVSTELPGKGTWYRVRVGDFATMQEASVAKTAFERENNVIAYVAGTGPAR
jgi:cell division protein FtsN